MYPKTFQIGQDISSAERRFGSERNVLSLVFFFYFILFRCPARVRSECPYRYISLAENREIIVFLILFLFSKLLSTGFGAAAAVEIISTLFALLHRREKEKRKKKKKKKRKDNKRLFSCHDSQFPTLRFHTGASRRPNIGIFSKQSSFIPRVILN